MPGGRPTDYRPEFCDAVQKLNCTGTDSQIAEALGVSIGSIWNWKQQHPEFMIAIRNLKHRVDDQVEDALLKSATTGSNVAQIFWLKNRRRQDWQDRRTYEADPDNPPTFIIKSVLDKQDKE